MSIKYKLKSGQINYEDENQPGCYSCIVIREGVFHNLLEEQRLDLIKILQSQGTEPKLDIDLDDMF